MRLFLRILEGAMRGAGEKATVDVILRIVAQEIGGGL